MLMWREYLRMRKENVHSDLGVQNPLKAQDRFAFLVSMILAAAGLLI